MSEAALLEQYRPALVEGRRMFWKKQKTVDQLVDAYRQTGDLAAFEKGLAGIDPETLPADQREGWYQMWGVAAYRADDHAEALRRFEMGATAFPQSGQIGFSLGQEYEYIGQTARAFETFDRFIFPLIPASYALAQARYAYLWGDLERATAYVLPIFVSYFELGVADDTFLYMRGLPFFGQSWAYLAAFSEVRGNTDRLEQITSRAKQRLSDYDFDIDDAFLESMTTRDFRVVLEAIRARDRVRSGSDGSDSYTALQLAAIQSLEIDASGDPSAVESVSLAENSFPWLQDIKTGVLAALALMRGDAGEAAGLTEQYVARQPSLFEPDHAFRFRLVKYQEGLMPAYRERRVRNGAVSP